MRRKRRQVLQVRLEEEVVETRAEMPFLGRSPKVDLWGITQAIRKAARDRRIGALVVRFAHPDIGWAKAASLARAIEAFRSSGKPVVAFLEGAGNLDYGARLRVRNAGHASWRELGSRRPPSGGVLLQRPSRTSRNRGAA